MKGGSGWVRAMIRCCIARVSNGGATGFPRHLARHYVSALAEDPGRHGLGGFGERGVVPVQAWEAGGGERGSGLSDNLVEALLVDREGKLWVGTHGGLNRLRPKNLSVISYNEGLGNGAVQGLAEVSAGGDLGEQIKRGPLSLGSWRYFRPLSVAGFVAGGWTGGGAADGKGRQLLDGRRARVAAIQGCAQC